MPERFLTQAQAEKIMQLIEGLGGRANADYIREAIAEATVRPGDEPFCRECENWVPLPGRCSCDNYRQGVCPKEVQP